MDGQVVALNLWIEENFRQVGKFVISEFNTRGLRRDFLAGPLTLLAFTPCQLQLPDISQSAS